MTTTTQDTVKITGTFDLSDSAGQGYTFEWRGVTYTAEAWSTSNSGGLDFYLEDGQTSADPFNGWLDEMKAAGRDPWDSPFDLAVRRLEAFQAVTLTAPEVLAAEAVLAQARQDALALANGDTTAPTEETERALWHTYHAVRAAREIEHGFLF